MKTDKRRGLAFALFWAFIVVTVIPRSLRAAPDITNYQQWHGNSSSFHHTTTDFDLIAQYEPIVYLHPGETFLPVNVVTLEDLDLGAEREDFFLKFVEKSLLPTMKRPDRYDVIPPALRKFMRFLTLQALIEYLVVPDKEMIYYARQTESSGYVVLQYWFFYMYNSWGAYGIGANIHEGDWEMITIFVPRGADEPEYVAYSAHGHRGDEVTMPWEEVPKENGHPIVYVSLGSHANRFQVGIFREVVFFDSTSAEGLHIGPGQHIEWGAVVILRDDDLPLWASDYAGNWGLDTHIDDNELLMNGFSGPRGPVFQGDRWGDPVGWAPPP
jgi:hypothetical protein